MSRRLDPSNKKVIVCKDNPKEHRKYSELDAFFKWGRCPQCFSESEWEYHQDGKRFSYWPGGK